jgi:hypothetical protein
VNRALLRPIATVAGGAVLVASAGTLLVYLATEPTTGTVVGKEYEPAYTDVTVISTGKTTTVIPIVHGECYDLTVRQDGREGDVCVSAADYKSVHLGDYWGGSQ